LIADQIGALQQVIGVAEADRLLAFLVHWHEGHVPDVAFGVGGDGAGGKIRNEFDWHAELLGQCASQVDGDTAISTARTLDHVERGGRGRNRDCDAQLACRNEFFHDAILNRRRSGTDRKREHQSKELDGFHRCLSSSWFHVDYKSRVDSATMSHCAKPTCRLRYTTSAFGGKAENMCLH